MQGGRLREYITIQQKTETIEASGDVTFTWSTLSICFAEVKTLSGKEMIEHGKVSANISHRVYIRSFDATGILPEMRIVWTDRSIVRYLDIYYINEDRKHDRYFEVLCQEGRD